MITDSPSLYLNKQIKIIIKIKKLITDSPSLSLEHLSSPHALQREREPSNDYELELDIKYDSYYMSGNLQKIMSWNRILNMSGNLPKIMSWNWILNMTRII